MLEIKAPSGAKVLIGVAPFADAIALKNAIAKEVAASGLNIDIDKLKDFDVSVFTPAILAVDSSDKVFEALFKCLARCSYNGDKITEKTFEPEDARADYYDVALACVRANLSPFFKNLASRFSGLLDRLPKKEPGPE